MERTRRREVLLAAVEQASRTIDVVIPTRNTHELTLRCLDSLTSQDCAPEIELRCIVVDNGSEDGTYDATQSRFPSVQLIRNERNAGFGEAINQGAREGKGTYVLVLNSDAVSRPGAVLRLARYLDEDERCVVAAGKLVDPGSDRPQVGFAVRAFPSLAGQLALMTGLERYWPRNPVSRRQALIDFDYDRTQEVHAQPAGACLMIRRADFEAIGGFDEGFLYWFEDVDLVRQLADRGTVAYVHDAVFEHDGGATFDQWSRPEVIVARFTGLLRYFEKHHSVHERVVLRSVVAALAALRVVALAPVDHARSRAYARVFRIALPWT